MYNTTFMDNNMTSFAQYLQGVNDASSGLMGLMILIIIAVVLFVSSMRMQGEFDKSFAFSSLITSILAGFMWGFGMIGFHMVIIPAVLVVFSVFLILFNK